MDRRRLPSSQSNKGESASTTTELEKGKETSLLEVELEDDEESSITKKFGNLLVVKISGSEFKPSVEFDKAHNQATVVVLGQINADHASTICDCKTNNTTIIQIGLIRLDVQTQVGKYVICGLQNNTTSKGQSKQDWENVERQAHKKSTSFSSVLVLRTCKSSTSFAAAFVEANKLSVNHKCRFRIRPYESKGDEQSGKSEKKDYVGEPVLVSVLCSHCQSTNWVNFNPYNEKEADNSKVGDTGYLNGTCSECHHESVDPSKNG